jgi:hypothetical protein
MLGDPRECRERAVECLELARHAKTAQHKTLLTEIAQTWLNLASGIERVETLLRDDGAAAGDGFAAREEGGHPSH